jgi:hypothetical protein
MTFCLLSFCHMIRERFLENFEVSKILKPDYWTRILVPICMRWTVISEWYIELSYRFGPKACVDEHDARITEVTCMDNGKLTTALFYDQSFPIISVFVSLLNDQPFPWCLCDHALGQYVSLANDGVLCLFEKKERGKPKKHGWAVPTSNCQKSL